MTTPYLIVSDAAAAIDFYIRAFEATELVRLRTPDGKTVHAELELPGGKLMLADEHPDMGYRSPTSLGGSGVSLHVLVENADAVCACAIRSGAKETMAVSDQFDGERRGTIVDPFGPTWLIATKLESISYDEMAERFTRLVASGDEA
jgi:PhnB protein